MSKINSSTIDRRYQNTYNVYILRQYQLYNLLRMVFQTIEFYEQDVYIKKLDDRMLKIKTTVDINGYYSHYSTVVGYFKIKTNIMYWLSEQEYTMERSRIKSYIVVDYDIFNAFYTCILGYYRCRAGKVK